MTQSLCKHDKKSRSHPGMKVTQVRVFSCTHPLRHLKQGIKHIICLFVVFKASEGRKAHKRENCVST